MTHTRAWRLFRRMEDTTCILAGLIYAAAALHAWQTLPGPTSLKSARILVIPGLMLVVSLLLPLAVPVIRRVLKRYVWMSFQARFGQTAASVLIGLALLVGAALFIYGQTAAVANGGPYPGAVFSSYGAGIGILIAQAILVRALERDPDIRPQIEQRE